jgi:hypothetical protein
MITLSSINNTTSLLKTVLIPRSYIVIVRPSPFDLITKL